jgi:hypothetical protein
MSTTFILGYNASLAASTTSGGSPSVIGQLKTITYSGDTASYADITNLSSPSAVSGGPPVSEYAPSLITPSTCTVTGILNPGTDAGQTLVSSSFASQELLYFTHQFAPAVVAGVTQTTGAKRTFTGYISKKPVMNSQLQDAVSFDFEIKITGVVTDVAGVAGS